MSHATLAREGAGGVALPVAMDPHDVHAIIASLNPLPAGSYMLKWDVLSADGHAVSGTLHFTVTDSTAKVFGAAEAMHENPTTPVSEWHVWLAMLVRGIGMTALMGFAGLLFFLRRQRTDASSAHSAATVLGAVAVASFILHFFVWISSMPLGDTGIMKVFYTSSGRRESIRVDFASLAMWGWWLARRPGFALAMAFAGLMASAFIGHAAAIDPAISITFKAIHLVAGAIWLGGLVWLVSMKGNAVESFAREANRVSNAAGICALLVLGSGLIQTAVMLSWSVSALTSSYALVAALKLLGVIILLGMGAFNRYKLLPALDAGIAAPDLQGVVRREIALMVIVAMLGGVLAYLSPPMP
jgi:copper transport protein